MKIRCYSELKELKTFEERFEYLQLNGDVGHMVFGSHRYMNQAFYNSAEWKAIKREVTIRDLGCDLGVEGFDIIDEPVVVHHMNIITLYDLAYHTKFLIDPEYLICTRDDTHKAIHYGDMAKLRLPPVERKPNDTCPWRR